MGDGGEDAYHGDYFVEDEADFDFTQALQDLFERDANSEVKILHKVKELLAAGYSEGDIFEEAKALTAHTAAHFDIPRRRNISQWSELEKIARALAPNLEATCPYEFLGLFWWLPGF